MWLVFLCLCICLHLLFWLFLIQGQLKALPCSSRFFLYAHCLLDLLSYIGKRPQYRVWEEEGQIRNRRSDQRKEKKKRFRPARQNANSNWDKNWKRERGRDTIAMVFFLLSMMYLFLSRHLFFFFSSLQGKRSFVYISAWMTMLSFSFGGKKREVCMMMKLMLNVWKR